MIGYIKGKIILKGEDFLIVESNGVGYKVFVSQEALKKAGKSQSQIEVFVWPYLKRTTIELYGCLTQKEFEVFEVLEGMVGIGPKTALSLAAFGSLKNLKTAIEKKDANIKEIKGVGPKRLKRLMVELTGKIGDFQKKKKAFPQDNEVLQGLLGLGFSKKAVRSALSQISNKVKDPEQQLQEALKILARK